MSSEEALPAAESGPRPLARRVPAWGWWVGLVLVLLLAGLLPYFGLIDQVPWGSDASKWVSEGSLDNRHWWRWATDTRHFVGYRPVTALSYVLNHATTGYAAWGYRLTDLTLHLLVGLLVFLLFRSWTGDRGGWGLLAVVVVLGHPATEEVLPYLARRSYLLATVFGLGGLLAFSRAVRHRGWWLSPWAVLAAALLGLAVLSNELAYVLVPLLPLLALHQRPAGERWWRPMLAVLPMVPVLIVAIARRFAVLGHSGGYKRRYFAYVGNGIPRWKELAAPDPQAVLEASWEYLLFPNSVSGTPAVFLQHPAWLVVVGGLVAWLGWVALVAPWWQRRSEVGRLPWVLATWMLGATGIILLSETWFWRQAYALVVPLGLLMAWAGREAARRAADRGWRAGWWLLPLGLLAVSLLANGPLVGGMDPRPHRARLHHADLIETIDRVTADLVGPGTVYLVLPAKKSKAHMVRIWADRTGRGRDLRYKLLANTKDGYHRGTIDLEVEQSPDGRTILQLDPEQMSWSNDYREGTRLFPGMKLHVDRLALRGQTVWVLALDGEGDVFLEEVPPSR